MSKSIFPILPVFILFFGACGEDMLCADGTMEHDGRCVAEVSECGPGTMEQEGACVPLCLENQRWDGSACVLVTECAPGTVEEGGRCVPLCANNETWDGEACQSLPTCGTGTEYDPATGECLPSEGACAAGSSLVDGMCVPDVTCGEGTHADASGECVADDLGPSDVAESTDPTTHAVFDLPAEGASISLGGLIDEPFDSDEDGLDESDWDGFNFHAPAGTYLRIRALSGGASRPALVLLAEDPEDRSQVTYIRYSLEPNASDAVREFYLPKDDDYVLLVTDYNHLAGYLFGSLVLPVGGAEFSYQVVLENLGTPEVIDLETMPDGDSGQLDEGQLHFYRLPAVTPGTPAVMRSIGEPSATAASDVFAALMIFNDQGLLHEQLTGDASQNAEFALNPKSGQDYLVVLDHLLMIGSTRDFEFQLAEPAIEDCDGGACASGSVPIGSEALLRWDLQADDLLMARFGMAESAWSALLATWVDGDMNPLQAEQYVYPGQGGWGRLFAEEAGPRYLWLRWSDGDTPGDYLVEDQIKATTTLAVGETASGLTVDALLPGSVPDMNIEYALNAAAFENLKLNEGQIVFFDSFTPTSGAWSEQYSEWLVTPEFEPVGPIVDTNAWNFPDGFITPTFAYIRHDRTYLHWVYDLWADITGATYDVRPVSMSAEDLGAPTADQPISVSNQLLGGSLKFYSFEGQAEQSLQITVDPALLSTNLQPEVWVFNFGRPIWDWIYYRWQADPDAIRLGLVEQITASAGGETATLEYLSPYDGMSLILVMDAGSAGPLAFFSVDIQVTGN